MKTTVVIDTGAANAGQDVAALLRRLASIVEHVLEVGDRYRVWTEDKGACAELKASKMGGGE